MNTDIQRIDEAIAEIHLMASLGQGLDVPRLRELERRRKAALVAETASETVSEPLASRLIPENETHRGTPSYPCVTRAPKLDAVTYIRIDRPRNTKYVSLLVKCKRSGRKYYPSFSVDRGEFTNSDDFRRLARHRPDLIPRLKEFIMQQLTAREGEE